MITVTVFDHFNFFKLPSVNTLEPYLLWEFTSDTIARFFFCFAVELYDERSLANFVMSYSSFGSN